MGGLSPPPSGDSYLTCCWPSTHSPPCILPRPFVSPCGAAWGQCLCPTLPRLPPLDSGYTRCPLSLLIASVSSPVAGVMAALEGGAQEGTGPSGTLMEPWGAGLWGSGRALAQAPGLSVPAPRAASPPGERSRTEPAQTRPRGRTAGPTVRPRRTCLAQTHWQMQRRRERKKQGRAPPGSPPPRPPPRGSHRSTAALDAFHTRSPFSFSPFYNRPGPTRLARQQIRAHIILSFGRTTPPPEQTSSRRCPQWSARHGQCPWSPQPPATPGGEPSRPPARGVPDTRGLRARSTGGAPVMASLRRG